MAAGHITNLTAQSVLPIIQNCYFLTSSGYKTAEPMRTASHPPERLAHYAEVLKLFGNSKSQQ